MKRKLARNEMKRLSKQLHYDKVAIDELEDFCFVHPHLDRDALVKKIWEKYGMFGSFTKSKSLTFFTTKGGVLKTTLAFNFARLAALSGIKTIVVGLDMQCDITNCISGDGEDSTQDLETALEKMERGKDLYSYFNRQAHLDEIVHATDLECLYYIPESPNLTLLNDAISLINRREFWLKDKVLNPLYEQFDLVIFDCSPNWNRLTTNALCCSDLLVSPVECKVNNFKNIDVFKELIEKIKEDLFLRFDVAFVPTRFSANKKLSVEILKWYQENLVGCLSGKIRESIESEEAVALQKSIVEYQPSSNVSRDILYITHQICNTLCGNENPDFRSDLTSNLGGKNQPHHAVVNAHLQNGENIHGTIS